MRSALAFIAMTLPAYAEPSYTWGNSSVTLSPADAPAVARIDYRNGFGAAANISVVTVTLDGLAVTVTVEAGPGMGPDTYTVTPPEGYVAVPQTGVVEEHEGAVVLIYSVEAWGV